MKRSSYILAAALLVAGGIPVIAQQLPPLRQIGPVQAVTSENLGAVSAVRHLPGGRVLVNDIVGRRVLLFDSTLKTFTVVADTTSATANAYGARAGGLIPFRGDSTLFVDPASLSMLVLDANGKVARVMAAPRASDAFFLVGGPFGSPAFDPQGRLIYRAPPLPVFTARAGGGAPSAAGGTFTPPTFPDSMPIVRIDLATRNLDTVAFIKTPKVQMNITREENGRIRAFPTINPLPVIDDWGVLPDGTIALVRGRDYHVDWIAPDKSVMSTAKIPFEWQRLSDEAKVAFIDSTKKAMEEARASGNVAGMFGAVAGEAPVFRSSTTVTRAGGNATTTTVAGAGSTPVVSGRPDSAGGARPQLPPVSLVDPAELPDYKPAFAGGATRVDADGNLWIRTTHFVNGVPVYNVVNRSGQLTDRVQLPAGRVVAGFGPGGIIYLGYRDGNVARLEKARIR